MSSNTPPEHEQAARHDPVYDALSQDAEFIELRRRYRSFVIPVTVGFLAWFLLYVVMSNWASDFMGYKLFGNINVALVFGLLQFASTFAIAYVYSRYSTSRLDPLGHSLNEQYEKGKR